MWEDNSAPPWRPEDQGQLWLARPRAEVFPFFWDARNLQVITPDWRHFTVLTPEPIRMMAGTLIDSGPIQCSCRRRKAGKWTAEKLNPFCVRF